MSNAVAQKSVTYFEWTVQNHSSLYSLPLWCSKIDSKRFKFQDLECYLEFYTDTANLGDACLYFKRYGNRTQFSELEVIVFVSWTRDSVKCSAGPQKCKIRSGYEQIWRHESGKFLGTSLTFQIIINSILTKKDECVQTGSYLNADASVESLSIDFSELLDSGVAYDAEIKCGTHSIKAHKNILCARSEVLRAMLESDMVEGQTGIVEIRDTDVSYIEDFVRYLYTGEMPELIFVKAKALYEFGDKYLVRSLVLRCAEYLQDNLAPENACQCLLLADVHFDKNLKDRALAYILDKKVYLQEDFWLPFCNGCTKLANEVYRVLQCRTGLEKKVVATSDVGNTKPTMTVLKKSV